MKIWLINHYAVPTKYYPLARPASFAKYLMREGHEVTIFAASTVHNSSKNLIEDGSLYRDDIVDGIRYVYVKASSYQGNGIGRIWNMFQFPHRLPRVCRHYEKPDVILSVSATPMACYAGIKLARNYQCQGIAEVADLWPESFVAYGYIKKRNPFLSMMYAYEKRLYKKADKIIFTMEGGRDYIIEKGWDKDHGGSVDLKKVHHINNGVDLEVFNYNKDHYTFADPDLDDPDTFKVVYTGSVRLVNNVGTLLSVAKCLQEKGETRIKILIYGDGDQRIDLEEKAKAMGLDHIVFKGNVDKKYIPYILSKCDLTLLHCQKTHLMKYGMSMNKSFDYLASGKPILQNFEISYDYISKFDCGICKTFLDDRSYAEAIFSFYEMKKSNYSDYHDICNNALCTADMYDFKKLTEQLIELIKS